VQGADRFMLYGVTLLVLSILVGLLVAVLLG
jgi:hypothetical protein